MNIEKVKKKFKCCPKKKLYNLGLLGEVRFSVPKKKKKRQNERNQILANLYIN